MEWKFSVEDNEAIPATNWGSTVPVGFSDCTNNIIQLDSQGLHSVNYSFLRKLIQNAVVGVVGSTFVNWANLTDQEKDIASKWIVAPYALRLTRVSDSDDRSNWDNVLRESREGRCKTVERMRLRVGEDIRTSLIVLADAHDFYFSLTSHVEGFKNSAAPDFIQWITNEVGSSYEIDGFEQKSYHNQPLEDDLVQLYNGEFKL